MRIGNPSPLGRVYFLGVGVPGAIGGGVGFGVSRRTNCGGRLRSPMLARNVRYFFSKRKARAAQVGAVVRRRGTHTDTAKQSGTDSAHTKIFLRRRHFVPANPKTG